MKYLDEGDYFICSNGLMPSKLHAGQTKVNGKGGPLLTHQSTATQSLGDFGCRWTAVLATAAATFMVMTGGAALVAVGALVVAGGVAGSGLLCGGIMAGQRKWLTFNATVARAGGFAVNADDTMVCPLIGGVIRFAPGIDSPWKAWAVAARNVTWAAFEGMAVGFIAYSGGGALLGRGAAPLASFGTNLLKNYGASLTTPLGAAGRLAATLDQVYVEGMLINGETQGEAWREHGWRGATVVEQSFITIGEKVADHRPVTWQDYYYAGLTVGTLGLLPAADVEAANLRFVNSLTRMAGRMKKGLVLEGVKKVRQSTEIEAGKIAEIRKSTRPDKKQNVAYCEGVIDAKQVSKVSHSGQKDRSPVKHKPFKDQKLRTHPTARDIENAKIRGEEVPADRRAYDSEVKILEELLDETTENSEGTIKIVSDLPVCESCSDAIIEFRKMRPHIKVEVVYVQRQK